MHNKMCSFLSKMHCKSCDFTKKMHFRLCNLSYLRHKNTTIPKIFAALFSKNEELSFNTNRTNKSSFHKTSLAYLQIFQYLCTSFRKDFWHIFYYEPRMQLLHIFLHTAHFFRKTFVYITKKYYLCGVKMRIAAKIPYRI